MIKHKILSIKIMSFIDTSQVSENFIPLILVYLTLTVK